jgi:hypothetical protein
MKAKIISTGEIINIADYARVTLDKCDDYGNPIEVSFEDIELIKDSSSNINWQQVRIQAAIAAMQGMLSNDCSVQSVMDMSEKVHRLPSDILATMAVSQADALIEELKGE